MTKKKRHVFVFMGVSGSGKSTVAKKVANELNAAFLDGDFLHPKVNILKMRSGSPLNDADRLPWLARINEAVFAMSNIHPISIIVCSALKRKYREMIRDENDNLYFIYLKGSFAVIESRLKHRQNHYQKTGMLQSQFDALEEPNEDEKDVFSVEIDQPLEQVVKKVKGIICRLG